MAEQSHAHIHNGQRDEMIILGVISVGLISIVLSIVLGLFIVSAARTTAVALPNWAENVLVAIATGATLKLGDTLSALVALATGRQVESFGNQLAKSAPAPIKKVPETVQQAADQVADAATAEAEEIGEPDLGPPIKEGKK